MKDVLGIGGIIIKRVAILSILVFIAALTCNVFADQPVPAVPETQGLVTSTGADVVGMATETDAGAWTLTNSGSGTMYTITMPDGGNPFSLLPASLNQLLAAGGSFIPVPGGPAVFAVSVTIPESLLNQLVSDGGGSTWEELINGAVGTGYSLTITKGGIHSGVLSPGQVQYTTAYDANIVSQAGHTVLSKSMNINTGNRVITQSNLDARTLLTYIATGDAGNVVGSENLLIDGAGNTTSASDRMICPFASQPTDVIPAYCNIVQTGNSYDLTVGSVTSAMSERFVGTDATVPVQLDQAFNVKPYGTTEGSIPAIGLTSAYIKAHIQEARGYNNRTVTGYLDSVPFSASIPGAPLKAEDLQYSETSSASGVIQQFTKVIHYQSGKSLMP